MKAGPDQVKFMMIDPKMVELSVHNDIPHLSSLLWPTPKGCVPCKRSWMRWRNVMSSLVKWVFGNLEGYNAKVEEFNKQSAEKQIPLPWLSSSWDELADLMMVASKEVEDAIIRLGQKARQQVSTWFLATQRPSVDAISGLIKANAFADCLCGCLVGRTRGPFWIWMELRNCWDGDMLFSPIGESHPVRLQGSFISDGDGKPLWPLSRTRPKPNTMRPWSRWSIRCGLWFPDRRFRRWWGDPLREARPWWWKPRRLPPLWSNAAYRLVLTEDPPHEELAAGVIGPAEGTKPRKVLETQWCLRGRLVVVEITEVVIVDTLTNTFYASLALYLLLSYCAFLRCLG